LKSQLEQHLLLRGSRNFGVETDYDTFLHGVLKGANDRRTVRLGEELAAMKLLPPTRLSDYDEVYCRVSSGSTIRVKKVGYSVPARLIGHEVKVEVHEQELKVYSGRELLLTLRRHRGKSGMVLDYRHVIEHLLRKPGAFERYRYREELFPTLVFRQAYDRLVAQQGVRKGSVEYLRLLKLASEVSQDNLELMLVEYVCPPHPQWTVDELRALLQPQVRTPPALAPLEPEWSSYDALLTASEEVAHVG
jgi:hypothetical protein